MAMVNGPHHFHMTNVDEVVDHIEQYFNRHLDKFSTPTIPNSKL